MDEATLRILEFEKIRSLIAGFTQTLPGSALARALAPLGQTEEVARSLAEAAEMQVLHEQRGRPPLGGTRELGTYLKRLSLEGVFLPPEALLDVLSSIDAAADCRRYLAAAELAPRLFEKSRRLEVPETLRRLLRESIGPRGEILDGASFSLADVRRNVRLTRERIRRALEALLNDERLSSAFQERLITERNGRYVVPVRADHRGQIKGFVHDESASGQTLYVEPAQTLADNNALQALLREEKREEERILRRLSEEVRILAEVLGANQRLLAQFDLCAAAARFAIATAAVAPRLEPNPVIALRAARHPLLLLGADGRPREMETVPVDLLFGGDGDTLIISGPNTGGKTVALKTLGLLTLMVRCGLPIPCHPDSSLHLFGKIFADIGDEQSIEASLSTFSGHLLRIRAVLEQADGDSLVLLDELGTGTDPAEGGALAMAVLDSLRRRGARTVVTTHLNLVKGYALLNPGVENAAVTFDHATLRPTYRLYYGAPGASNAFTIARTLGLDEAVLQRAQEYLGSEEREGSAVLEELNRRSHSLEADLGEARRLREAAQLERDKRRRLLEEIEARKREILEKALRRGDEVVRQAETRVKRLLKEAQALSGSTAEAARLTREVRQVREDLGRAAEARPRPERVPRQVRAGELLRIPALGAEAEVVRVVAEGVELSLQGKKLRLPLSDVEQHQPPRYAKRKTGVGSVRSRVERTSFQPRLKLVGERVDEALARLQRFLDDALLQGMREVEVVHGAGSGALRRAVREFLAAQAEVESFHAAELARGGDNVTIVLLRGA
ncbi:DNA mismatch repair protein MutS2 [Geoalkalibacter ferrihydriticus]|uniref:Endonuclease MutS2 n=2 Tax=Geoalkalibacter ferrihydriticus TaxID=392333 RepID=A0A0C2DR84_9BACT|nr:endonuclease MutS2 [Geoalkalibacter ferrihydriticus]KIH75954.1 DNA mismatch repair protein MutS [Geoalkalibacter ferrihydriticus DSM 17813]SDM56779.1 DNA mismatch repair protein MutS2 [Geoalkalibacter ferrihydriticus]